MPRYNSAPRMNTPKRSAVDREWRLPELLARAGVRAVGAATLPRVKITSLTDDSRAVQNGSLFVAVRGTSVDGHSFLQAAAGAGAAAMLVDQEVPAARGVIRVIVDDTRAALPRLAAAYYGLRGDAGKSLRLIGITGTNGKTTAAWLLRSILKAAGHRTALIGTIEYDLLTARDPAPLTTPGALQLCRLLAAARDAGAVYGVLELSSHALHQRRCDGLSLAAGVFTNLSGDHLDYHQTMESYGAAKRRLFDLIRNDAVAVLNRDDAWVRSLASSLSVPVVHFGLDEPAADVTAQVEELSRWGSRFVLRARSFETVVRFSLVGRHNVSNALAAAATAEAVGIAPPAIRAGLEMVTTVPGRLQRVEPKDRPFSVLVDYAHTDAALLSVLSALRPLTPKRLICVFGCGGDRDRSKRPRMAAVVGQLADVAYVTSDNPRTEDPQGIVDEIVPGFGPAHGCRVEVEVDRRSAIQAAIAEARPGDTVLIAGKGHEPYQLVGDKVLPFDDVDVARECLNPRAQSTAADPSPKRERGRVACFHATPLQSSLEGGTIGGSRVSMSGRGTPCLPPPAAGEGMPPARATSSEDRCAIAHRRLDRSAVANESKPVEPTSPVETTSPVGPTFQSVKSQAEKPLPHEELA